MAGSFAIYVSPKDGNNVYRQEVRQKPIPWCGDAKYPLTVIGDDIMVNYTVTTDVFIEECHNNGVVGQAVLGARVRQGTGEDYCYSWYDHGYYWIIDCLGEWMLLAGPNNTIAEGSLQ